MDIDAWNVYNMINIYEKWNDGKYNFLLFRK